MRGILSHSPDQPAVRLLVGAHLLMLVQSLLVLLTLDDADGMLRTIIAGSALLGLTAFAAAVHGGAAEASQPWWRTRRAR